MVALKPEPGSNSPTGLPSRMTLTTVAWLFVMAVPPAVNVTCLVAQSRTMVMRMHSGIGCSV